MTDAETAVETTETPEAPAAPVAPEAPAAPEAPDAVAEPTVKRGRKRANKADYRSKDAPQLTEWPADYNPARHKPLLPEDFSAEDVFWDHKAVDADKRAATYRRNADMFRKFGSADKIKAIAAASKHLEKLLSLKAELEASGLSMADANIDLNKLTELLGK